MRFSIVLVPAFLLLAGTGYFIARPKENAGIALTESRMDPSPVANEEVAADEYDADVIRRALNNKNLTDAESAAMIGAAGRRYMRRKIAYDTAVQSGVKSSPDRISILRENLEKARHICNVAESFGRHTDLATIEADIEMEQRLSTRLGLAEHHDGRLTFSDADLKQLEHDFLTTFGRALPVSAHGESAVHRAMGFDHRGRTDVAVSPDTTEGSWVRRYLTAKGVSYFAFRSAVRGKATGAHIHIGPASGRRSPGV